METDTKQHTTGSDDSTEARTTPLRQLPEASRSKVMEKLWMRLGAVYGADRWERAFGARWSQDWLRALGNRTVDDLARGIGKCERDDSGRLPTLGQFVAFTREFQPGTFAGASAPPPQAMRAIEDLTTRSVRGKRWQAFMWREGLRPRPPSVTDEDIAAMLDGADIEQMRQQHAQAVRRLAGKLGV